MIKISIVGLIGIVSLAVVITAVVVRVWCKMEIFRILQDNHKCTNFPVGQIDADEVVKEMQLFLHRRFYLYKKGNWDDYPWGQITKVGKIWAQILCPGAFSPFLREFVWIVHLLGCEIEIREQADAKPVDRRECEKNLRYISRIYPPNRFCRLFSLLFTWQFILTFSLVAGGFSFKKHSALMAQGVQKEAVRLMQVLWSSVFGVPPMF